MRARSLGCSCIQDNCIGGNRSIHEELFNPLCYVAVGVNQSIFMRTIKSWTKISQWKSGITLRRCRCLLTVFISVKFKPVYMCLSLSGKWTDDPGLSHLSQAGLWSSVSARLPDGRPASSDYPPATPLQPGHAHCREHRWALSSAGRPPSADQLIVVYPVDLLLCPLLHFSRRWRRLSPTACCPHPQG